MVAGSPPNAGQGRQRRRFHDLGLRAVSGVVLAICALGLTFAGGPAFVALVTLAAVLMCWEWGRIVRGSGSDAALLMHAVAVGLATLLAAAGHLLVAGAALLIGGLVVLALCVRCYPLLCTAGVFYAGVPAVALVLLRGDTQHGFNAVMFVMLAVWTVDIAAFLGGRTIGGPKLWPAVSPNKTWAGLISGVGTGVLSGSVFAAVIGAPVLRLALITLVLGLAAQGGDLAESALKRAFGAKDSSWLIPGHGGVMDRLDGVVAAATLALLIGLLANTAAPARALLFGA